MSNYVNNYQKCKTLNNVGEQVSNVLFSYYGNNMFKVSPSAFFAVGGVDSVPKNAKLAVRSIVVQKYGPSGVVTGTKVRKASGLLTPAGVFYVASEEYFRRD